MVMRYVTNRAREIRDQFREGYRRMGRNVDYLRNVTKADMVRDMDDPGDLWDVVDAFSDNRPSRSPLPERLGETAYRFRHPHNMKKASITAIAHRGANEHAAIGTKYISDRDSVEWGYSDVNQILGKNLYRGGPKTVNKILDEVEKGNIPEGAAREALIPYFQEMIEIGGNYLRRRPFMPFRQIAKGARDRLNGKLKALQSGEPLETVRYKAT